MRKRLATILFLALAGCGTTQSRNDVEASNKRYLLGADYFNKGMDGPALEELLKAVKLDPNNADAHNLLGLVFLRKGAEAEEMSQRAQCLKGEDLRLEKQDMDSEFGQAEAQFKEAVRLRGDFSEALNNMAVVALHFGRYDDAITLEQKALSNIVYREPFAAEGNLGLAYLKKGDRPRAAKELRQSLFDQPRFCVGRYRLAKVYYDQGEYDAAAEQLDAVIKEKGCPIQEAYQLAGIVALRRGDRAHAAELFRRCVMLAPHSCLAAECDIGAEEPAGVK